MMDIDKLCYVETESGIHQDSIVQDVIEYYNTYNCSIVCVASIFKIKYGTAYSYCKGLRRNQSAETIPKGSTPKQVETHSPLP